VEVIDGYGAWATQTFTITVQEANTAPASLHPDHGGPGGRLSWPPSCKELLSRFL